MSDFGILCLTRENIESPWLLFEAGSLAKSFEHGKVVPFLLDLDLSDISGPLAPFQAKKVGRSAMAELLQAINQVSATPSRPLSADTALRCALASARSPAGSDISEAK